MPVTAMPERAMPESAVALKNLSKTYRAGGRFPVKDALKSITLDIPRGVIFGLLGPNGAGKSTLINILAGLVRKTSGEARVWGYEVSENPRMAKASIGVVPQELNLDAFFSPRELLELQSGLYGVPKAERDPDELLRRMNLQDKANAYARSLSGGMRRRLMVAKALVHNPPVLVLDEPTAGVDVELRRALWASVRDLNARGVTVLLTTHYLEEAQALCDRIAIIHKGEIVANDTTTGLLSRLKEKEMVMKLDRVLDGLPAALTPFGLVRRSPHEWVMTYRPDSEPTKVSAALKALLADGVVVADITTHETDLETVFLALTQDAAPAARSI